MIFSDKNMKCSTKGAAHLLVWVQKKHFKNTKKIIECIFFLLQILTTVYFKMF